MRCVMVWNRTSPVEAAKFDAQPGKSQAPASVRRFLVPAERWPGLLLTCYDEGRWQQSCVESLFVMSILFGPLMIVGLIGGDSSPLERTGRLDGKLIPEASGIVKSRRYPGIFWVHNDSGNPPLLFAIKGDGRIVRQFRLAIPNIDWEDIACDDQGHLYLGDIGNNTRALPLRAIYRIDEPDPNSREDKPISASAVTFYALPRENRFDAESLFYHKGTANLLAKYLDGREAELFEVRLDPPSPLLRPARPRSIGRLPGFTEAATGADLSADGTLLAVCSSTVTRVYRRDDRDALPWRRVAVIRYQALPIEGIAWDGGDLRLVAEGGGFYRLTKQTWRAGTSAVTQLLGRTRRGAPFARDDYQHLARGGQSQRDTPATQLADKRTGLGSIFQQFAHGVQFQAAFAQVPEEGRVLVHDPDDPEKLTGLTSRQRNSFGLRE